MEEILRDTRRRLLLVERRLSVRGGLPARFGPNGAQVTDWNLATEAGFYWADASAANRPPTTNVQSGIVTAGKVGGVTVLWQTVRQATDPLSTFSFSRYRQSGGTWSPWRLNGKGRGTAALRGQVTPHYWDFWQDTDGTQHLYVGNKTGGWRKFSGRAGGADAAWQTTQTSGAVTIVGRTASVTIDTVLESSEDVIIGSVSVGSGFGILTLNGITRNPTNTVLTIRFMQLAALTTQAFAFDWQIIQANT
jgi:hypothetical protein